MRGIGVLGLCPEMRGAGRRSASSSNGNCNGNDKSKTFYERRVACHPGDGRVRRSPRRSRVWSKAGSAMEWVPKVMTWSGPTTR